MVEISTVFCLAKKNRVDELKKSKKEIQFFCKEYDPSFVEDKFILLAEDTAIYLDLFENRVNIYIQDLIYYL